VSKINPQYEKNKAETGSFLASRDLYTDADIYTTMVAARITLLRKMPFFGICALGLKMVETYLIDTAGVDGWHLFYNPSFIKIISKPPRHGQVEFVVAHEIFHVVAGHIWKQIGKNRRFFVDRMAGRDHAKWNIACDHVVNLSLIEGKIGTPVDIFGIYANPDFSGMSVEQVYELIKDDPENGGGKSAVRGSTGQGGRMLDEHIVVGISDDQTEGTGEDGMSIPKSAYEDMMRAWEQNLINAHAAQRIAEQTDRTAGALPAGLRALIEQRVTPVIPWPSVLMDYVERVAQPDFSYASPNKALFQLGITMPGFRRYDDELEVAIAVDSSGSISEADLVAFLSEIDAIMDSFVSFRMRRWTFDAAVHPDSFQDVTKENRDQVGTMPIIGRGGTQFEPNWDFMKEMGICPRLLIVFTDGMPFDSWGDPNYCPTLFVIKGNEKRDRVAPFGITTYYEDM
jgi:predicted metal-dependent peptidase